MCITLHSFNQANQIFTQEEVNTIDSKYYSLHGSALLRCHHQGILILERVEVSDLLRTSLRQESTHIGLRVTSVLGGG
jgi:hypothetical protein